MSEVETGGVWLYTMKRAEIINIYKDFSVVNIIKWEFEKTTFLKWKKNNKIS